MIQLTRLNNHPLIVNSDLIKFGEKIVVLETSEQVLEKIVEFRRLVLSGTTLCSSNVPGAPTDEPPPGTGVGAG